jgi:hypothetical protein
MNFGAGLELYDSHYPRVKASVILCPFPDCSVAAVDEENPLINEFTDHIRIRHQLILSDEVKDKIIAKMKYLRTNESLPYLDPFLYVPYDDLFK